MGRFIITQRKNGEFQFNLEADNGEVILTSEGYAKTGSNPLRRMQKSIAALFRKQVLMASIILT